jgi:hypothetical protein
VAARHPWLGLKAMMTRNSLATYPNPGRVRENFFCERTPQDVVDDCFARLQNESSQALNVDMVTKLVNPERVTTPLLVLEAEDVCWGHKLVRDIARAYRTDVEFFPKMGHNMMLEPGWQAVAGRIDGWLTARGL